MTKEREKMISSDPIAEEAGRYAIEVTDPKAGSSWASKFVIISIVLLVLVGSVGAVLGTINTVRVTQQTNEIELQQACQKSLLKSITIEQEARTKIAADDRKALNDLVANIATAKSSVQVELALDKFKQETKDNERRRAQYPVPTFDENTCQTK